MDQDEKITTEGMCEAKINMLKSRINNIQALQDKCHELYTHDFFGIEDIMYDLGKHGIKISKNVDKDKHLHYAELTVFIEDDVIKFYGISQIQKYISFLKHISPNKE